MRYVGKYKKITYLHVDLTVKQVHSGSTYLNCYTVMLVDWKGL